MGYVSKIAGPLVVAGDMHGSSMYDVVRVGKNKLIGEIIQLKAETATIQVYEDTSGIMPGDPVESKGRPLYVELGPGLLTSVYDGVQRPLDVLKTKSGTFIERGVEVPSIDRNKRWNFIANKELKKGTHVSEGAILGYVQEMPLIKHYIMVPVGMGGVLVDIDEGEHRVEDTIARVKTKGGEVVELTMLQKRVVRAPSPYKEKLDGSEPLITGMRLIDTLFPLVKGGVAAIPGPFGSGKTVTLHSIAKYANSNIIVYIGCGERGNEMSEVLTEFPELKDPLNGRPLMERTVLVANTSNMPVAAREASIYTGMTIAEYFRDMGYDVALMADSTSRWAEAMREISARLEEMPGEEGYPPYLSKRLAEFYERAGRVTTLGGRTGSVSAIGAVSPSGGDISEPVSQGTLRVVKVYWALDPLLASASQYPAINWLLSYSRYKSILDPWYAENVSVEFTAARNDTMRILQHDAELKDIVQLVGEDALPDSEKMVLDIGRVIKEDFLRQSAYDPADAYASMKKQYLMLDTILDFYKKTTSALEAGARMDSLMSMKARARIARMKEVDEKNIEKEASEIKRSISEEIDALVKKEGLV